MNINVRHDAPIEVTVKAGRKILSREVVEARLVDAHLAVQSYMAGGVSGMVNWHDREGNSLSHAPKVTLKLMDESFQLADDEECMCADCVERYN